MRAVDSHAAQYAGNALAQNALSLFKGITLIDQYIVGAEEGYVQLGD